jgi:hypothetical protein
MSDKSIIRGNLPPYVVLGGGMDKLGVFKARVNVPHRVGTAGSRIDVNWLKPKNAPNPFGGIPAVSSDFTIRDTICWVTFLYEGISYEGSQDTFGDTVIYELRVNTTQEPVETHPAFAELAVTYEYDYENRRFPDKYATDEPNPLYKVEDYLVHSVALIERKLFGSASEQDVQKVGYLDTPPSSSGIVTTGGLWVLTDFDFVKRGNVRERVKGWMAVRQGSEGTAKLLYTKP